MKNKIIRHGQRGKIKAKGQDERVSSHATTQAQDVERKNILIDVPGLEGRKNTTGEATAMRSLCPYTKEEPVCGNEDPGGQNE